MKTADEITDETMSDWPTDAPHLALLRQGIADKIKKAVVAAQRDAVESAAKVAEDHAKRNSKCSHGCRCGDGFHISLSIRALVDKERSDAE